MDNMQAMKIIEDEELKNYNWFNDHEVSPNEICIRKVNDHWSVFTSDERCSKISEQLYQDKSKALEDFIERLKADKILRNL